METNGNPFVIINRLPVQVTSYANLIYLIGEIMFMTKRIKIKQMRNE